MSSSPCFLDEIVIPLVRGSTVLDVGCGYGRWAHLLTTNYWEAHLARPPTIDGLDAFQPNVDHCRARGTYRHVWRHELPQPIEGQWDTVLACEIIEHLSPTAAEATVAQFEAAARQRVIISTPNYPYLRDGSDTILGYNPHEAHHSHLPRRYFRQRGYTIVGAGFGNPRHPLVRLLYRACGPRARYAFQSLAVLLPATAECFVAFRNLK